MLSSSQEGRKCFSVFVSVFVTSRVGRSGFAGVHCNGYANSNQGRVLRSDLRSDLPSSSNCICHPCPFYLLFTTRMCSVSTCWRVGVSACRRVGVVSPLSRHRCCSGQLSSSFPMSCRRLTSNHHTLLAHQCLIHRCGTRERIKARMACCLIEMKNSQCNLNTAMSTGPFGPSQGSLFPRDILEKLISHSLGKHHSQPESSLLMQMRVLGATTLALKPRELSSTATESRDLLFPTLRWVSRACSRTYRLLP